MAGPAFKSGVMLPHPVLHPEVAPTALAPRRSAAKSRLRPPRAAPIEAALVGDPGETIAVPDPPDGARDLVLTATGFEGTPPAPRGDRDQGDGAADLAGLYDDELFDDALTAQAAAGSGAGGGRRRASRTDWTDSRDWPITEYQMLAGGYPVAPFVASRRRRSDHHAPAGPGPAWPCRRPPTRRRSRGIRGLARPHRVRRAPACSTPRVARGLADGAASARPTFTSLHVNPPDDCRTLPPARPARRPARRPGRREPGRPAGAGGDSAAHATANRHSAQAQDELMALAAAAQDAAQGVPGALVVITSRGATTIDDPGSDFYGPGSSRHVPLVLLGPRRARRRGHRPAGHAGRFAGHHPLRARRRDATDVAQGSWADGHAGRGGAATDPGCRDAGHALLRAFLD